MDRVVVEQKLESLRRCLQRVKTKCPADADTLAADFDLQDIVSMNLSRAVHLCVDIGAHLIASTEALPPDTETFEQLAQTGVIGYELALKLKKQWAFATLPCITTMPSTGSWFTALCRTIWRTSLRLPKLSY